MFLIGRPFRGDRYRRWDYLKADICKQNMSLEYKYAIIKLLRDYVDCFAWNYCEMPGLNQELVGH
jgi:hypothetical protein